MALLGSHGTPASGSPPAHRAMLGCGLAPSSSAPSATLPPREAAAARARAVNQRRSPSMCHRHAGRASPPALLTPQSHAPPQGHAPQGEAPHGEAPQGDAVAAGPRPAAHHGGVGGEGGGELSALSSEMESAAAQAAQAAEAEAEAAAAAAAAKEEEEEEEERAEEDQGELLFAKAVFLGTFSCVGSI